MSKAGRAAVKKPILTTRLSGSHCPVCAKKLDAVTDIEGWRKPRPLDLTICLNCAQVLVFDPILTPRLPRPGEVDTMYLLNPALKEKALKIQAMARSVSGGSRKPN